MRLGVAALLAGVALAAPASAAPVGFRHGVADQQFTTTQPGAPSGFTFSGSYHAAGDTQADPPYMRRMIFYSPPGTRYDTSVPDRCTASDLELETRGPSACPPGSVLGKGSSDTSFMGRFRSTIDMVLVNNADEQIIIAASPLEWTVARGRIRPDGSIEYASPTCYPSFDPPGCPVDDALQIKSAMNAPAYVKGSRSYITTPPACPASGHWETPVKYWWADGTEDTVVTEQPCVALAADVAALRSDRTRSARHRRHARSRTRDGARVRHRRGRRHRRQPQAGGVRRGRR